MVCCHLIVFFQRTNADSSAFVPDEVEKQLAVRDVVVVRPADARMTFNQFIDLIEKKSKNSSLFSAYLEYTSMTDFLRGR